jgi:hypothetical protein
MVLTATEVYHLAGDQLRLNCAQLGLNSGGPVRELRSKLVDHLKNINVTETESPENTGNCPG